MLNAYSGQEWVLQYAQSVQECNIWLQLENNWELGSYEQIYFYNSVACLLFLYVHKGYLTCKEGSNHKTRHPLWSMDIQSV
jgi:hypothetical protein